jgi:tRNA U34 5-methylaminomethyl-2-thiouridine-forming methyltransferase MnmC
MQDQQAGIDWRDDEVPVSTRFDDPYFSLEDGLAETRHVFLSGNDLPARFRDGFHVAELGFGTGLNLLAALDAWRGAGVTGRLCYSSFEAFPMTPADMRRAQARFAEIGGLAAELAPHWQGGAQEIHLPDLHFTLVVGDAREKNPEMWQPELMAEVARHTVRGGTAATYTAAGHVRRGLEAAGFSVTRVPGYGRKRHMTRATRARETPGCA